MQHKGHATIDEDIFRGSSVSENSEFHYLKLHGHGLGL